MPYLLYREQENDPIFPFHYVVEIQPDKIIFTNHAPSAQKCNLIQVIIYAAMFKLSWINNRHTEQNKSR
jgi:hypothetical protein